MKLTTLITILCLAVPVAAFAKAPTDFDREEFYEKEKEKADRGGWKFNKKNADKLFDTMDTDGDGILTGKERKVYWDNFAKNKKSGNKKKEEAVAKEAAAERTGNKGPLDWNREEFYAKEKEKADKNGWPYNESNAEKLFRKMDSNNDGVVTGVERKTYWDNWKKSQ